MDANSQNVLLRPLRSEHLLAAAKMAAHTGGRNADDLLKIYERD